MAVVTVSPKFQVVIPRDVREELGIEVGQKIQVIAIDNRLEMIPVRSAKSMRGFLKGIDTRSLVEVRFLTAVEAQTRFGINANGGPVIVLLTSTQ